MRVNIKDLTMVEYNPREIDPQSFARLKQSIIDFSSDVVGAKSGTFRLAGTVTVNRNGNRVVGGNQRVKALLDLGQSWIDSRDITYVTMEPASGEEMALNIALNAEHMQGMWEPDNLGAVLADIKELQPELFDGLELQQLEFYADPETFSGPLERVNPADSTKGRILLCYETQEQKQVWLDKLGKAGSEDSTFTVKELRRDG